MPTIGDRRREMQRTIDALRAHAKALEAALLRIAEWKLEHHTAHDAEMQQVARDALARED